MDAALSLTGSDDQASSAISSISTQAPMGICATPKGCARAHRLAKHLAQQFAGAIGHQVLLGEITGGVHQAHHLDDALDAVQVPACQAQQPCSVPIRSMVLWRVRGLAFFGCDVLAKLRSPGLPSLAGDMAAQEDTSAGLHIGHIGLADADRGRVMLRAESCRKRSWCSFEK